ncbi:hypothetical protein BHE74_00024712, partial [Ensete ventricosum]
MNHVRKEPPDGDRTETIKYPYDWAVEIYGDRIFSRMKLKKDKKKKVLAAYASCAPARSSPGLKHSSIKAPPLPPQSANILGRTAISEGSIALRACMDPAVGIANEPPPSVWLYGVVRRWAASANLLVNCWATYEERGSEQDEREVGYSPQGEEASSGAPTGKKGHRERLTMAETRLDVLEASVEELYQGQGRLLGVESSQEEVETRIENVESLIDQLTEDTKDFVRHLHEVMAELTAKLM